MLLFMILCVYKSSLVYFAMLLFEVIILYLGGWMWFICGELIETCALLIYFTKGKKEMKNIQRKIFFVARNILLNVVFINYKKYRGEACVHVDLETKKAISTYEPLRQKKDGHLRMVCISDIHLTYGYFNLPPGDVLIITGDTLWKSIWDTTEKSTKELKNFNDWIGKHPHKYKILIGGNHDKVMEEWGPEKTSQILYNCTYLQNNGTKIEGATFYGSPMSILGMSNNRAFQISSEKFYDFLHEFPRDLDVLLSHSCYRGDMQDYVDNELKPRVHIFGHLHEEYGIIFGKNTTFVNCCIVNRLNLPTHLPVVIDLPLK